MTDTMTLTCRTCHHRVPTSMMEAHQKAHRDLGSQADFSDPAADDGEWSVKEATLLWSGFAMMGALLGLFVVNLLP